MAPGALRATSETNKIFGSGLSNGSVIGQSPAVNGLPIDSSWIATYQDQGIVGDVLEGVMFLVLLVRRLLRPRGPARAMALFLIMYCLFASFTETGMGEASTYLLDLTVAASLARRPLDSHTSERPVTSRRPVGSFTWTGPSGRIGADEPSGVELQGGLELVAAVAGAFTDDRRGGLLLPEAGGVPPEHRVGPAPDEAPAGGVRQVQFG